MHCWVWGPCPHLPALQPTWSSQLERDIKLRHPQEQGTPSSLCLNQADTEGFLQSQFSHWKTILSEKKMCLGKAEVTKVSKINPNLPVAQSAPKGERGNLGREQEQKRNSLIGFGTKELWRVCTAFSFVAVVIQIPPDPCWLCISHLQPRCRLLG